MSVKELIKKEVDKLPETLADEVYDFIMFLVRIHPFGKRKSDKNNLAKSAQSLSTIPFQKIWDNEEDAVYDNL